MLLMAKLVSPKFNNCFEGLSFNSHGGAQLRP